MKYIPHTEIDRKLMLDACGVSSIDEFFSVIPDYLKPTSFDIPQGLSEMEILPFFERLAANNRCETTCFIGGGFYDHFIPAVVDAIASRSAGIKWS